MDRIEKAVEREFRRFAGLPPAQLLAVLEAWPQAVGGTIAANATPARVARDGTLHVAARSSTWAFELGQLAPKILERLRELLGEGAPKALRFALGEVAQASVPAAEEAKREPLQPGPIEVAEAARLAAGIEAEDLREAVQKAAALSLARAAAGRDF